MPAYFVVYRNVSDPARYADYLQSALPIILRRGGRLVMEGVPETMEGNLSWQEALILEWPSRAAFLDFWHSEEYAQIKPLREGAAEWQAALIADSEANPSRL